MVNADNRYTVIVSDKAADMLVSHTRFIANVSDGAAKILIDDFTVSAKSLETLPDRNTWITDSALPINKCRKLIFSNRYMMIYQIKNSTVYVDYIIDCRQDYGWLL